MARETETTSLERPSRLRVMEDMIRVLANRSLSQSFVSCGPEGVS